MGPTNILLRNLFSLFAPTLLALAGTYLINQYTPLFTSMWIWGIVFFSLNEKRLHLILCFGQLKLNLEFKDTILLLKSKWCLYKIKGNRLIT